MNLRQTGMTLVELIITIVIIGIAAAALFSAMAVITSRSADPMLRQQSLMIAESYLETLSVKPYGELGPVAEAAPVGLDGVPIAGLSSYKVRAVVVPDKLNPGPDEVAAKRIEVIVTDPRGDELSLNGWRTCYGEDACP